MNDILAEIVRAKRARLARLKTEIPLAEFREKAIAVRFLAKAHTLIKALSNNQINIIAEFKRRSPSRGRIRDDANVESTARSYELGGAAAVSVLTEEDYFDGSLNDLRAVKPVLSIPVLRKDFILDEFQVYESAIAGADALLLIVAILNDEELIKLRRVTEDELGLDALVEVHNRSEMQRALASGAKLVGVNNRDLKTFEVSLETSVELAREALEDVIMVSESGLNSAADLNRLKKLGYTAFLIGESLMRAKQPADELRALMGDSG